MSIAKRHHTVPQFYLRGFADRDQISTVRLPGTVRFTQSVRKAASEINFYSVNQHPNEPDIFEKVLAKHEGEAAAVFAQVEAGVWPLKAEDRLRMAQFIVLQAVRGPDQRRNIEHLAAQTARLEIGFGGKGGVKGWAKQRLRREVSDEEADELWRTAVQPDGPPIRVPPLVHIKHIANLTESLVPYVIGRPWSLVHFRKRRLITCDSPVSLIPPKDKKPWEGVGFMTAWGISYPLTRRLGLLLSDPMVFAEHVPVEIVRSGAFDRVQDASTRFEQFFNDQTIRSASEWLYHHPDDAAFVPHNLPDPEPLSMKIHGDPIEFSGEPLYKKT